ncbi:MAG: hypothetical protein U0840_03560 [Gemmataceae bacterium]
MLDSPPHPDKSRHARIQWAFRRRCPPLEVTLLVLIAVLLPLALYLLALGWINRQPRPVFVPGTWDLIGLIAGLSGVLLVAGPACLSFSSERWRMLWVLGETGEVTEGLDSARQFDLLVAALYFALVVTICIVGFLRRRRLTAIYNVDPAIVEDALLASSDALGLEPVRSGTLLVFGLVLDPPARPPSGLQPPHARHRPDVPLEEAPLAQTLATQHVALELEPFAPLYHVNLIWDPADTPLRPLLEDALARRLAQRGAPYHDTAAWLNLIGSILLAFSMLIAFTLLLLHLYNR